MTPVDPRSYRRDEPRHLANRALAATDDGSPNGARNRLCAANVGLVHHVARRCGATADAYDDAVSAGVEALLRVCARWDPDRGVSLAHYAEPWIRQAVVRSLRAGARARAQLREPTGAEEDSEAGSVDRAGDPVDEAIGVLSRRHALVRSLASLDADARSTFVLFVAHLGDEAAAAAAASTSVGAWRRRCDRVWSMLRHPAGPCLGADGPAATVADGGYRRWRIAPPPGTFVERAACRGLGVARFFPDRGTTARAALAVCAPCPVRTECAAYAVTHGSVVGVWGGTVGRERRAVRVAATEARSAATGSTG